MYRNARNHAKGVPELTESVSWVQNKSDYHIYSIRDIQITNIIGAAVFYNSFYFYSLIVIVNNLIAHWLQI